MSSASWGSAQDADERSAAGADTPDTASAESLHVAAREARVTVDEATHPPVSRHESGQSPEYIGLGLASHLPRCRLGIS
jgi:hypothetical protein